MGRMAAQLLKLKVLAAAFGTEPRYFIVQGCCLRPVFMNLRCRVLAH